MTRSFVLASSLLLLPALGGCDPEPQACEAIDFGLRSAQSNGMSKQGISLQGISLQGRFLNGTSFQGRFLNGISIQGRFLNGNSYQGRFLNGSHYQRRSVNGVGINGIDLEGVELEGIDLAGVELVGTALQGTDAEGRVQWGGDDFVGARLPALTDVGEAIDLTIAEVRPDPIRADLVYYVLTVDGINICGEDGQGLFVDGVWDDTGARHDADRDGYSATYSCTTGVIAKCVAWGYTPYGVGTEAHQTCTRLARADYCGDGVSYTKDGTEIDVFDRLGVMRPEDDLDMRFEAGWGPGGAVCVHAPRYDMVLPDGDDFLPWCWSELPACADEATAIEHGAVLSNRNHGDLRHVCEP